ncbi:unnamed protein product [Triticum turgidum subsp. durum]|uniref:Uncharacterized protein n=1 Tax=Triticum turgidum subsp. durum TaxID=4567 RepID=A0A9R1P1B3_TRITD|nr:unnamed protein product [Triticum turgidum subsp. durum]
MQRLMIVSFGFSACRFIVVVQALFSLCIYHVIRMVCQSHICCNVPSFMQLVSCGDISLISSYEKVENCVYTSTLLRKCGRWGSEVANPKNNCSRWKLTHAERFAADFYITDAKSGKRALVKAGYHTKVVPLIDENVLVTTSRSTDLSSTLKCWLQERNLSSEEAQLIRLEEGYITEGMKLSVIGILSKKNGDFLIFPPREPISTGCVLLSFLLPAYFDGIVLRLVDKSYFMPHSGIS